MSNGEAPYSPGQQLPDFMASAGHSMQQAGLSAAIQRRPLVLIVNPGGLRERGGMGRMVRYLVESWRLRPDAPRAYVLDSRGLGSVLLSPFFLLRTFVSIARYRVTDSVALVHVNMAENMSLLRKGLCVLWAKALGLRVVLHLHAGLFNEFYEKLPAPGRAFARLVFRSADRTIVLGEIWRRKLVEALRIAPSRIGVVYNGVPIALPHQPAAPGTPCRLLYTGKLRDEKGLVELFTALGQPAFGTLSWTLTLVGEGERKRFEDLAKTTGIAARVRFAGWLERDRLEHEMAHADIFVLPSHYEGMPLGVLEALSAGLAVVATAVGALPEVLREGQTALLVPPRDETALAAALMRVITDAPLRQELARAGHALYEDRFTVARFAAAIEGEYAAALAR